MPFSRSLSRAMRLGVTDAWGPLRRALGKAADAVRRQVHTDGTIPDSAWEDFSALLFDGWRVSATDAVRSTITRRVPRVRKDAATDNADRDLVDAELRAQQWVRRHGLELVKDLTDESKRAVKRVLRQAMAEGWDVPRMVRTIKGTVGLNERFARAVVNMDSRLRAAGKPGDKVDATVRRYADKLMRARAEMVARTETVGARNEGHLQSWIQMQADGDLPSRAKKVWVAAPRIACAICQEYASNPPRAFTEPFDGPMGPLMRPPSHQNCRCACGVI